MASQLPLESTLRYNVLTNVVSVIGICFFLSKKSSSGQVHCFPEVWFICISLIISSNSCADLSEDIIQGMMGMGVVNSRTESLDEPGPRIRVPKADIIFV